MTMSGFVQKADGKYYDLETEEEIEVQILDHPTYGLIRFIEYENKISCTTCGGTGLIEEEDCIECEEGIITEPETAVMLEGEAVGEVEGLNLPSGWRSGGELL